jgi:hypothetical protein
MNGAFRCMAKFIFVGAEKYIETLEHLGGKGAEGVLKYAVYPGADVLADAIRAEIEANHYVSGDLADSLTLTTMRNDSGYVNTKVSFVDYDENGVPNALKAAVLESGTSNGRKGTHFISKTVKRCEAKATEAMSKALDQKMNEIMEG